MSFSKQSSLLLFSLAVFFMKAQMFICFNDPQNLGVFAHITLSKSFWGNFNSKSFRSNPYDDIDLNKAILWNPASESNIIQLLMSSDGVSITKSSTKKNIWPIWLALAQLPPILRMSVKNILAGLYVGGGKPVWSEIVPHVRRELNRSLNCSNEFSQINYQVSFEIIVVADLVAKANMLNMYQYNGTFGSNFCTARGHTIERTHGYFPYGDRCELRTPAFHHRCVSMAESLNWDVTSSKYKNSGVKGRSEFECLVKDIPLSFKYRLYALYSFGRLPSNT